MKICCDKLFCRVVLMALDLLFDVTSLHNVTTDFRVRPIKIARVTLVTYGKYYMGEITGYQHLIYYQNLIHLRQLFAVLTINIKVKGVDQYKPILAPI